MLLDIMKILVSSNITLLLIALLFAVGPFSCTKDISEVIEEEKAEAEQQPVVEYSLDTIFAENYIPHVPDECSDNGDLAKIRIRNLSLFEICNIEYTPYYTTYNFGSLMPGESTCFIAMDLAYSYPASIKFQIRDTVRMLNATDLIGEPLLAPGYYNFNLSVVNVNKSDNANGRLTMNSEDMIQIGENPQSCRDLSDMNCPPFMDLENQAYLRVVNTSIFDFCNFSLADKDLNAISFEKIRPGESTCYLSFTSFQGSEFKMNLSINETSVWENYNPNWTIETPPAPGLYSIYVGISDLSNTGIIRYIRKDN